MVLSGNFDEAAKFRLGDVVEDDIFGESVVIGLPSRNPAPPAPGRVGTAGSAWVKCISTGTRRRRGNHHLVIIKSSAASEQCDHPKKRSSPRLEQAALKKQRAPAQEAEHPTSSTTARRRITLVPESDGEDDEHQGHGTDSERDVPTLAAHERSRKMKKNRPRKKEKRPILHAPLSNSTKATGVSLHQRLSEFPNTGLKISGGKLFCASCKKQLPNLKTSIATHVASASHQKKLRSTYRGIHWMQRWVMI